MLTNFTKIPIKLGILLVGFGLLVVGCDSAGPSADDTEQEAPEISYEITNDVGDRIEDLSDDNSSNNAANNAVTTQSKDAINFEVTTRVTPPNINNIRASHLTLSDDPDTGNPSVYPKLYVGYKTLGSTAGGGIDILEAKGNNLGDPSGTDINALQSDNLDIQEVAVRHNSPNNPSALYAAADVDVDFQRRPQLHSITVGNDDGVPDVNNNDPVYEFGQLDNLDASIAKGVVDANGASKTYAVSDEGSIHAFNTPGNGRSLSSQTTEDFSGTEFRSVARASSGTLYALTYDGSVREFTSNDLSNTGVINNNLPSVGTTNNGNDSKKAIARLTVHDFSNGGEFLFAAMGTGGLHVIDLNTTNIVFSDDELSTPSVTATDNYLYAATGENIAIYEVRGNDPSGTSPRELGREDIADLAGGANTPNDAQINHILADKDNNGNVVLYVAKSLDGVYRLEETSSNAYN